MEKKVELREAISTNHAARVAHDELGGILIPHGYEIVSKGDLRTDVCEYSPSFRTQSFDSFIEYVTAEVSEESVETIRPICWVSDKGRGTLTVTANLNRGSSKEPVTRNRRNSQASRTNFATYSAYPNAQWRRIMGLIGGDAINQKQLITELMTIGVQNITGETSMDPSSEYLAGSQVLAAFQSLTADIAQQTTVRATHSSIEMSAMDKVAAKSDAVLPMILNIVAPFSVDFERSVIQCLVEYPVTEIGDRKVVNIALRPLNLPEIDENIAKELVDKVREAFKDLPIEVFIGDFA